MSLVDKRRWLAPGASFKVFEALLIYAALQDRLHNVVFILRCFVAGAGVHRLCCAQWQH
jgi:hypothetical protein